MGSTTHKPFPIMADAGAAPEGGRRASETRHRFAAPLTADRIAAIRELRASIATALGGDELIDLDLFHLRGVTGRAAIKACFLGIEDGPYVVWLSNPETAGEPRLLGRIWGTTAVGLDAAARFLHPSYPDGLIARSGGDIKVGTHLTLANCNPHVVPVAELGKGA